MARRAGAPEERFLAPGEKNEAWLTLRMSERSPWCLLPIELRTIVSQIYFKCKEYWAGTQ